MAAKALPSQAELLQLLRYDPQSGSLVWRPRPVETFATERAGKLWNTIYADKEAFTGVHLTGYRQGRIHGVRFKMHRVVWAMAYGVEPGELDHINGDRADNRLANLREVPRLTNSQNRAMPRSNTSGVQGVTWHKASRKWLAKINDNNRTVYLGTFDSFDEAVAARKAAEVKYGYHANHGRN